MSGTNTVAVRFLAPLSNGGLRITRYDIDERPGNRVYVCSSTNCPIHGLTNGVAYSFTVAAVNKDGRGRYSPRSNTVSLKAPGPAITFDANGGTGAMVNETENATGATSLVSNTFDFAGYTFAEWNTAPDRSGTSYTNGGAYDFTSNITLYAQWTGLLPPAPFPGGGSANWSGYILTGSNGGYQAVSAQWTVPTLNCSAVPSGVMSVWVGVNGAAGASSGLFQDGSSSECDGGQEFSFAWWTDQDQGFEAQLLFGVQAGDVIFAEVAQNNSAEWVYTVTDLTSGMTRSSVEPYNGGGTSAEWIVEDPTNGSTQALFPLADFAPVTITNLGLTMASLTWTLPTYDEAVEMLDSNGTVMTLPTPIQGSGTTASFMAHFETSA